MALSPEKDAPTELRGHDASPPRRTERGFERMLFFSDAVVAIAISLLILPLVDVVSDDAVGVRDLLDDHGGQLMAFALSFVVIAQYWIVHHQLFEAVTGYTPGLMWSNMLWLASIVFLPLPTEMLGDAGQSRAVHALYIGAVLASSASLDLLRYVLSRHPDLYGHGFDPVDMTTTASIAVALVVAVAVPAIGMWAMVLVILSGPVQARIERRRRRASRAASVE